MDGIWAHHQIKYSMHAVGLEEMENYIYRHHNTAVQYIVTLPIINLCLEVERRTGSQVPNIWWNQAVFELVSLKDVVGEYG